MTPTLAAYCWPQSATAGDAVDLAVSSSADRGEVTVTRVGRDDERVASFPSVRLWNQPTPEDAASTGCGWEPTLTFDIDPSWPSGFYLVTVTDTSGERADAFVVVRANEHGDALLVLSTSTWAAYNDWGGPSFYTGGHRSSLQRPLPAGFLRNPDPHRYRLARLTDLPREEVRRYFATHSSWSLAAGWANWERLFAAWAETSGLRLDYATSLDLHEDPTLLDPYRLYLSVGHDEYWSAAMRDGVEGWVDRGGLAAFLSGNTAFWQVRFESGDDGRAEQMIGYKMAFADDPVMGTKEQATVSTMWSDPLVGRPENQMTGVSFTRGGYANMPNAPRGTGGYTVWRPDHWLLDGIDLWPGDVIGAEARVVGYECDGCELALVDGLPVATGSGGTPPDFEVVATAPARLWRTEDLPSALDDRYVGELNWVAERLGGEDNATNRAHFANGAAVLGTFRRGRGEVVTVGCTDWAYGLGDPAIDRITRTIIDRALAR